MKRYLLDTTFVGGYLQGRLAATALERDLTIVTADSDFERVPGLRVMLVSRERLRQR